ncbi:DUF397 domain-containing protein [Dactylosporangium sp. NPDC049140]|uniref:DUF397 domain-containing protein n=1 Tax=unclassified Dactylosporangium TaxID=2621675 RepID=UPI0033C14713
MVGDDRGAPVWRHSSASGQDGCVEIAERDDSVLIRDSKNPDGPMLAVDPRDWRRFVAYVTR